MKTKIAALVLSFFSIATAVGQACSKYYPMEEGTTFQYTNYDKKNKPDGNMDYTVTEVTNTGDDTTATMNIIFTDEKGEQYLTNDYQFTCKGDVVTIDFESLIPDQMREQYKDMEMTIDGTDIELPNNLSVGQSLPDANVNLKISVAGAMNMNINIDTVNRKVEKKESLTTPAGTFDCYVIYSETKTKMIMANHTFPSRLWLAEGIGMVKTENYNKKGDKTGTIVLTKFEK